MTLHRRYQRPRIQAFQDGELPESRQDALTRHLEDCRECAEEQRRLSEVERLLTEAQPEPARLSAEASQALFERTFANAALPASSAQRSDTRLRLASYGAVALVLGIAALFGWRNWHALDRPLSVGASDGAQIATAPGRDPHRLTSPPALPIHSAEPAPVQNFLSGLRQQELPDDPRPSVPRRRHRRPHLHQPPSEPPRLQLVAAPVQALRSSWRKMTASERNSGAEAFEAGRAEQLLVVLESPPSPAPTLAVQVTHEPETAPGYAQAAAYQPESLGRGIWTQCTVSQNSTDAMASRYAVASVGTNQEKAFLDVQIASGGEADAKGANP